MARLQLHSPVRRPHPVPDGLWRCKTVTEPRRSQAHEAVPGKPEQQRQPVATAEARGERSRRSEEHARCAEATASLGAREAVHELPRSHPDLPDLQTHRDRAAVADHPLSLVHRDHDPAALGLFPVLPLPLGEGPVHAEDPIETGVDGDLVAGGVPPDGEVSAR